MIALVTGARAVIAAAVVLLGVSACSGEDPEPKVAPPESSAPSDLSTTPASGPTAPTMPSGAAKESSAGAKAFAEYFIDVLNFAQRTGDTAKLEEISTDACAGCRGYVAAIRETYDEGGSVVGGDISVGELRELPKDYGADWGGFARSSASSQVIVDAAGNRESYPGGEFPLYVYAKWIDGHWGMQWIRTPA